MRWLTIVILLAIVGLAVDRDARIRANGASEAEGHKICPFLLALYPKSPAEVPTSAYGTRIIKAIEGSAHVYRCTLPPLPKAP